ncbi:MAG: hypothetical protein SGARI_000103 [Bacillariaceae sp.]
MADEAKRNKKTQCATMLLIDKPHSNKLLSMEKMPKEAEVVYVNGLGALPESIGSLSTLRKLHVTSPKLSVVPSSFGNLVHLTSLHFVGVGMELEELPDSFGSLQSLEELIWDGTLSSNQRFVSLPSTFGNLSKLRTLKLSNLTSLRSLGSNFGALSSLQILDLAHLPKLKMLPQNFGTLECLERLNMDKAGIRRLPGTFGDLKALKEFSLCGCTLATIPAAFGKLPSLKILRISQAGLTMLPDSLTELGTLEYLTLTAIPRLQTMPRDFRRLLSLKELDISNVGLKQLPEMDNMNLERLNLVRLDHIDALPQSFSSLVKLRSLNIENVPRLQSVQHFLSSLSSMEDLQLRQMGTENISALYEAPKLKKAHIQSTMIPQTLEPKLDSMMAIENLCLDFSSKLDDLGESPITYLPNAICDLARLRVLEIHNAPELGCLPGNFAKLKRLENIWLQNLGISYLPPDFGDLKDLKSQI